MKLLNYIITFIIDAWIHAILGTAGLLVGIAIVLPLMHLFGLR
jgi:hypothetical protein